MDIEKNVTNLTKQWRMLKEFHKIWVIIYFLLTGIGSPAVLALFIPNTEFSSKTPNSFPTLFFTKEMFSQDWIPTFSISFISVYWFFVFVGLGMMRIVGNCQNAKLFICILIVIIDLCANFITLFLFETLTHELDGELVILTAVTIFSTLLITMIEHKTLIDLTAQPKNSLSHRHDQFMLINKLIQNALLIIHLSIISFATPNNWWPYAYQIILILVYSSRLYSLTKKRYFLQNSAHYLHVLVTIFCVVILIMMQIQSLFESEILNNNLLAIITVVTMLAISAFHRFNSHKQLFFIRCRFQDLLLMQVMEIITENEEIFYLDSIKQLYMNRKQKDSWFLVNSFSQIHSVKSQHQQQQASSDINYKYKQKLKSQQQQSQNYSEADYKQLQNSIQKVIHYILLHTTKKSVIRQCLILKLTLFKDIFAVSTYLHQIQKQKESSLDLRIQTSIIKQQIDFIIQKQKRKQLIKVDIEPVLDLQSRLTTMQDIILKDLKLKSLKWKHLCNNVTKTSQIQENVSIQIQNLIKLDAIYREFKEYYKTSLEFQSLALFYFGSVTLYTKKCQEITKNIKNIAPNLQKIELTTNQSKQFQFSIYSSKSCYLQLSIQQNLEQKIDFTIKNYNKNATKIFHCKKGKKLTGDNIIKFFPDFLSKEMKKAMDQSVSKNDGKVIRMYLLNCEGHVFEVLVSFRVIIMAEKVSCVMLILEKQVDKTIVLDSKGFIKAVGKQYIRHFTSYDHNMLHFSVLLSLPQDFQSLSLRNCRQGNNYTKRIRFLDISESKQWWIKQLENAKKWFQIKLKSNKNSTLHHNHSQNTRQRKQVNSIRSFDLKEHYKFTRKQRQIGVEQTINTNDSYLNDGVLSRQTEYIPDSLDIEIRYKKCKIGIQDFYVIEFGKVIAKGSKKKQFLSEVTLNKNGGMFLKLDGHKQVNHENDVKISIMEPKKKRKIVSYKLLTSTNDMKFQQVASQQSSEKKGRSNNHQWAQTSTNHSLSSTSMISKPLMNYSESLFISQDSLFDRRLVRFSLVSCFLCILVGLLILMGYLILTNYLKEEIQLMEIDCTVSDSFQLAQMLYNSAITYQIFQQHRKQIVNTPLGNTTEITFLQKYLYQIEKSFLQKKDLLMSSLSDNQINYNLKLTTATGRHFFQYLKKEGKWRGLTQSTGGDVGAGNVKKVVNLSGSNEEIVMDDIPFQSDVINIVTSELLMLYAAHAGASIGNKSTSDASTQEYSTEQSLILMKENFPQLKELNHYNIYHYSQLTTQTSFIINQLIYIFSGIHIAITLSMMLVIYLEKRFRSNQRLGMVQLYALLPEEVTVKLYSYFTHLNDTIEEYQLTKAEGEKNSDKDKGNSRDRHSTNLNPFDRLLNMKNIQTNQPYKIYSQQKQVQIQQNSINILTVNKRSPSNFNVNIVVTEKINFTIVKILAFAIIANSLFAFGLNKLNIVSNTIQVVVLGIGELMDTENYLLESFFDLKANFIISNPILDSQFFQSLLNNQQSIDVMFNKIALQSLEHFVAYDPQYSNNFIDLLRNNVCQVIKQVLNNQQYGECIDETQMQYFDDGIAVTMNYVTRLIYQTILEVQQKVQHNSMNNQTAKQLIYNILNRSEQREMDQNLFFIFRMFQLLQIRVTQELQNISAITLTDCQFLITFQIIIMFLIFPLWIVFNYKREKHKIAKLFLSLFLLNEQTIGQSKILTQKAVSLLQFDHGI